MFFTQDSAILTQEEQIDYIYHELKRGENDRKWSRIWKWFWRLFLIGSTFWLYIHPETIFNLAKGLSGNQSGIDGMNSAQIQQLIGK